ncbi:MAG: hypothetical protein V8T85_06730 [Blautia faecicola]
MLLAIYEKGDSPFAMILVDVVSMEKKKQKNKHKNIRRGMERFRVLFRIFLL